VGGRGLAPYQKKARDEGAHVVLIDESGFFLNPVVRRAWAPVGRTPVLTGFGRHRDKVSTIAAIAVAPRRRRLGLYWRTDPVHYIDAAGVVSFLRDLLRHLGGGLAFISELTQRRTLIRRLSCRSCGTCCTICGGK
jgi:hypothetical protein